ncbi:MAG TPA: hypothetical protein VKV29_01570 [Chthonomonas sp.]|uniref:hypothetical protein n=1 Tax=Chthonomonas sp. TaxID=2282153 RepID=UPI002B4B5EB0|nr:hypothetical protein [Chthonomonas sp.]HLH78951.1 hypothetical protein [Chthonomonas sp.]
MNSRYNGSHRRLSAKVVVNGVVVHNGSYSYDGGGRLAQVVDGATNQTEVYGWNGDGTLASAPGPGYTRGFMWNEEGQLVGIKHNGVLVYQYGYGADGNRRWRKDLVNNVWVWYPCGVACSAGELVEEVSDLSGGVWKVQALYLRAGGGCSSLLVRRNGEYHHGDVLGNKGVITDGSGNVLSSNVYDAFGVSMFISGSAQTPYRPAGLVLDVEGLDFSGPPVACLLYANRALALSEEQCGGKPPRKKPKPKPPVGSACRDRCIQRYYQRQKECYEDYKDCRHKGYSDSYCTDKVYIPCINSATDLLNECLHECDHPPNPNPNPPTTPPSPKPKPPIRIL